MKKHETARKLRKNQTNAEKKLWSKLRNKQLNGIKFRRQQPIGNYIVDFVTFEYNLIIEVDGGQHMGSESDVIRSNWLKEQGFRIIRFWNNQVLSNIEGVIFKIEEKLEGLEKE